MEIMQYYGFNGITINLIKFDIIVQKCLMIKTFYVCLNQTIIELVSQPTSMKLNHSPTKPTHSLKKDLRPKGVTPIISRSLEKKSFTPIIHNPFCGLVFPMSSDHLLREKKGSKEKEKINNKNNKTKHKLENEKKEKDGQLKKKTNLSTKKFIDSKLQKKLQGYFLFLSLSRKCLHAPKGRKMDEKYIVYIGKGNNSKLVKKIFSWRHWWKITNNPQAEGINLYWTQWSKKTLFERLQSTNQKADCQYSKIVCLKNSSNKIQGKKQIYLNQFNIILSKKQRDPSKSVYVDSQKDVKTYLQAQSRQLKEKQERIKRQQSCQDGSEKQYKTKLRLSMTCNHIQGHESITDKKNLFHNLNSYCQKNSLQLQDIVPFTLHINGSEQDYNTIREKEEMMKDKNMWIVKPGQKSNRGNGIRVFKKVQDIKQFIEKEKKSEKYPNRTYIIQKYIMPALFHRRKFDIRCFVLVIASPKINAYFYEDGYLRTSSKEFKQKKCDDKFMHLTNDAIQKKAADYGKFQKGNKVNFEQYQNYLDLFEKKKEVNFKQQILPAIKVMAARSLAASILNSSKKAYSFELIGYDFMLDEDYRPWLIQANTNPSLEAGCPLLETLFPNLINNVVKLGVDSVFKPPKLNKWPLQSLITFPQDILEPNKFELIYTEIQD